MNSYHQDINSLCKPIMCKTKKHIEISLPSSSLHSSSSKPPSSSFSSSSSSISISTGFPGTITASSPSPSPSFSFSLDEGPTLYPSSDIFSAGPTATRLSSSASRLTLRGQDVVIFRRPFFSPDHTSLPSRLASLCRAHHRSIARLLGASLDSDHIYLIYKHIPNGATLDCCLRNPNNPSYTLLPTWFSRIQVASDIAHALDYIHHHSFTVHNRIKSSSIIVTEPDLRAKLCYFGAAELAGEVTIKDNGRHKPLRRDSRKMKIEGTIGYMAPEVLAGGRASQKSDVFAFGVVLLEIVSGEVAVRYVMKKRECYIVSAVERAKEAVKEERVREWIDPRLKDSYPAEVAERVVRVALRCVEAEEEKRPSMLWVAGKLSRLFLDSKAWMENIRVPTDISVSFAPR